MLSSLALSLLLSTLLLSPLAQATGDLATRPDTDSNIDSYRRASDYEHHLSDSDGWEEISVSGAPYKYDEGPITSSFGKRSVSEHHKHMHGGPSRLNHHKDSEVLITWYTGHDLLNPACWENTDWAPTDKSMVAAVTLHGWKNKPKCKSFIKLRNSLGKSVTVRVVDACAGCEPGSAHVDLTRAAFLALAPLGTGQLKVHMSHVHGSPDEWDEELYGPK